MRAQLSKSVIASSAIRVRFRSVGRQVMVAKLTAGTSARWRDTIAFAHPPDMRCMPALGPEC
jgi:hypothetical protein